MSEEQSRPTSLVDRLVVNGAMAVIAAVVGAIICGLIGLYAGMDADARAQNPDYWWLGHRGSIHWWTSVQKNHYEWTLELGLWYAVAGAAAGALLSVGLNVWVALMPPSPEPAQQPEPEPAKKVRLPRPPKAPNLPADRDEGP